MTQTIKYPALLPGPIQGSVQLQQQERRVASDPNKGPFDLWAAQRDTAFVIDLTLGPFTGVELKQFRDWYKDVLNHGGNWFAARWPLPSGVLFSAFLFLSEPRYEFIVGGHWWVKGSFAVAGRGLLPESEVVEVFYTSWPYPVFSEAPMDFGVTIPLSGYLLIPPLDQMDLGVTTPQSGTLVLVLHSYSQPAEAMDFGVTTPVSATLVDVLHSYSQPAEAMDFSTTAPRSGTLVVVLVTYNPPAEQMDFGVTIPQSGTLV